MKENNNNIGTFIKTYPIDGNALKALELAIEKSVKKIPTLDFLKDEFC